MILAGDFRKGVTFVYNNGVYVIVDFQHVKPGKGAAFVRTKIKNVMTGAVREETFNPSEKFELNSAERVGISLAFVTNWDASDKVFPVISGSVLFLLPLLIVTAMVEPTDIS